jgi:hypothetical protein
MSARLRVQLEGALQGVCALFVVALGLAAGSQWPWNSSTGRVMRWAALLELLVVALALLACSRRGRVDARVPALLGALMAVGLLSAAWSVDAGLTLGRLTSVVAVFVVAGALALLAAARRDVVEIVLLALVAGVVVLALLGLVNVLIDRDNAIVPATTQSAARYNGIGGNPNTIAMLIALVLPAVVWCVLAARTRARRVVAVVALAVLVGSLIASGSRGALHGALLGTVVFALAARPERSRRIAIAAAAAAVFLVGVAALEVPQPAEANPVRPFEIVPPATPPLSPQDVQPRLPLESEIGLPSAGDEPFVRSLFTSSGRVDALRGALGQALERPLLGYGFGTEERVFTDRYYLHFSERPENSYLGTMLQLGIVGLALLLALLVAVAVRSRLASDGPTAACAGAVACGLVLAVGQSFLTSVGSPAMAPFWFCAALLVGATSAQQRKRLDESERGEREVEPAQRHPEAGLDVVSREDRGVRREQHDESAARAAARDGDD